MIARGNSNADLYPASHAPEQGTGAEPASLSVKQRFSSIEKPDLVDMVEAQLLDAIVDGRIRPGGRIVEAELARLMGVSRAPIREAARRLESQGILVSRPRHGFAVRTLSIRQLDELYQVRVHLEIMAARLACEHASDMQIQALLARVDDMVLRSVILTQAQRVALDLEFHSAICLMSGNTYLLRMFGYLQTEVRMILGLTEESFRDPAKIAEYHRPIAEAIMRRDASEAERALRHHLDDGYQHVRAQFASNHLE
jgi:DNA-binding GntR family transcriptional regulator